MAKIEQLKRRTIGEALTEAESALKLSPDELARKMVMPTETLEELKNGLMPYSQYEGSLWRSLNLLYLESIFGDDLFEQLKSLREGNSDWFREAIEDAIKVTDKMVKEDGKWVMKPVERN